MRGASFAAPAGGDAGADSDAPIELLYMTHNHAQSIPVNEAIIAERSKSRIRTSRLRSTMRPLNYEQKVLTAFAGGEGPDVFWAGDWMVPQFVGANIVAPVDPTAFGVDTQEEFLNLFELGSLDAFTVDGTVYTGGISEYNTFSLIYNVDAFAGIRFGSCPKTNQIVWEELADIAAALVKRDGDTITATGLTWPPNTPIWTVLIQEPMLRQLGGELVDPETCVCRFYRP
ncbi:MAG: extracellular solute-binding protein [Caldilineaceae bacterium]